MVAKSIEETLARYCSYISSRDSYADLIYCVESGDDFTECTQLFTCYTYQNIVVLKTEIKAK